MRNCIAVKPATPCKDWPIHTMAS